MKLKQSHKKQTEINYKTQFPINLILKDKIEKKKKTTQINGVNVASL
jgi:hypothetical protein